MATDIAAYRSGFAGRRPGLLVVRALIASYPWRLSGPLGSVSCLHGLREPGPARSVRFTQSPSGG